MKKTLAGLMIISFSLALAVPNVFSDENKPGFAGFGFRAGMTLSSIQGGDYGSQLKAGMTLGGFLNYRINDRFSLQGELLFTQRGEKTSGSDAYGNYKTWLTMNYLELPILAKYSFGSSRLDYYALAGPYFAFKLGGNYGSEYYGQTYESEVDSHYKGFDMGLKVGGGVGIPLSPSQLQIALIAGIGFLPVTDCVSYRYTHFFLAMMIGLFFSLNR